MKKRELFDKYIQGDLTQGEEKELLNKLQDDDCSGKFIEHLIETSMMINAAEPLADAPIQKSPINFKSKIAIFTAVAACLFFLFKPLPMADSGLRFTISESTNSNFRVNEIIAPDEINLDSGKVKLLMDSGTMLMLKGPCKIKISSDQKITLNEGLLNVRLPSKVKHFSIYTPHGSIKDLGTAFGLNVTDDETLVNVYEGVVEVSNFKTKKVLDFGKALRFSSNRDFEGVEYSPNIFNKKAEVFYLGERSLKPGEELNLKFDSGGQSITGDISLDFSNNQNLHYRIVAKSKDRVIYKSVIYKAEDKFKIDIPVKNYNDLKIVMEVTKGSARNASLNIKDIELISAGNRPYEGEVLIPSLAEWSYLFESEPPSNWLTQSNQTAQWKKGKAVIGYGDYDLNTKIGKGDLRYTTSKIYLKKEISINDLELNDLKKVHINLLADDGAVVYINGREVIRHNLPTGPLSSESRATIRAHKNTGEMIYKNFSFPADCLVMGKNKICVILYQIKGKSSDMRFDLKMKVY